MHREVCSDGKSARARSAFTLIELLIVVAIISILAAVAVPNFLEAQARSKVARVKTDMRSFVTAIEAYRVDGDAYPPPASNGSGARLFRLSTPITYIADPKRPEVFKDEGIFKHPPYGYHGRNERAITPRGHYPTPGQQIRIPNIIKASTFKSCMAAELERTCDIPGIAASLLH